MRDRKNLIRKLPTDIYGIRLIGAENYQRDFFWPISDKCFFQLSEVVFDAFDTLYSELDLISRDLIVSDSSFAVFLINHIHALAVSMYCRTHKIEILVGSLSRDYYNPLWLELADEMERSAGKELQGQEFRRCLKNVVFNAHLTPWRQIKGMLSPDGLSLGSASRIRQEYLSKKQLWIDNHYWSTLLRKADYTVSGDLDRSVLNRLEVFFASVEAYCSEVMGLLFDSRLALTTWLKRLARLDEIYKVLLSKFKNVEWFVMTEPGSTVNKLAAHASMRMGVRTVSFEHGNFFGGLLERSSAYNGPASCNEFVCPTNASADSFALMYRKSGISRYHNVRFTSVDTERYSVLLEKTQERQFPDKLRRVMVVGHPMTPLRYIDAPGVFFYFQLDLELRLVRLLKENGFEVLYKIHPYSARQIPEVFQSMDTRVIYEPFEKVWKEADVFLFKFTSTTTFGFALCTNLPIILLDLEKPYWQPHHYDMLSRRCWMVPAWTDEKNRIQFDSEHLLSLLSRKPKNPDFAYVKRYMFPDGNA